MVGSVALGFTAQVQGDDHGSYVIVFRSPKPELIPLLKARSDLSALYPTLR